MKCAANFQVPGLVYARSMLIYVDSLAGGVGEESLPRRKIGKSMKALKAPGHSPCLRMFNGLARHDVVVVVIAAAVTV